jgi:hypothetical protein
MLRAMLSRVERYLAHLDELSGGVEPRIQPIESTKPGLSDVAALVYPDLPDPGLMTGLTYGLSLAAHPEWRHAKPELCVCVRSTNPIWALAVGLLAEQLRGQCPFSYGDTIDFNERISPESAMTAFVVYTPAVLQPPDYTDIDVGDDLITIAGCYPIHDVERQYIHEHGFLNFWKLEWDGYDVRRPPAV